MLEGRELEDASAGGMSHSGCRLGYVAIKVVSKVDSADPRAASRGVQGESEIMALSDSSMDGACFITRLLGMFQTSLSGEMLLSRAPLNDREAPRLDAAS